MRIFLTYGHDEHVAVASRLKADLEGRGHEVWFDAECPTSPRAAALECKPLGIR